MMSCAPAYDYGGTTAGSGFVDQGLVGMRSSCPRSPGSGGPGHQTPTTTTSSSNSASKVSPDSNTLNNGVEVTTPGPHDVLLGRGGGTNNHVGNINFRRLVNDHKMRYLSCSKIEKPNVAREVVLLWQRMDPPGRFLTRKEDPNRKESYDTAKSSKSSEKQIVWVEVSEKKAREKASQCLRERTPDVVPYIRQLREQQDQMTEQGVSMVQHQLQMHREAEAQAQKEHEERIAAGMYGGDPDMPGGGIGGVGVMDGNGCYQRRNSLAERDMYQGGGCDAVSPMNAMSGGGDYGNRRGSMPAMQGNGGGMMPGDMGQMHGGLGGGYNRRVSAPHLSGRSNHPDMMGSAGNGGGMMGGNSMMGNGMMNPQMQMRMNGMNGGAAGMMGNGGMMESGYVGSGGAGDMYDPSYGGPGVGGPGMSSMHQMQMQQQQQMQLQQLQMQQQHLQQQMQMQQQRMRANMQQQAAHMNMQHMNGGGFDGNWGGNNNMSMQPMGAMSGPHNSNGMNNSSSHGHGGGHHSPLPSDRDRQMRVQPGQQRMPQMPTDSNHSQKRGSGSTAKDSSSNNNNKRGSKTKAVDAPPSRPARDPEADFDPLPLAKPDKPTSSNFKQKAGYGLDDSAKSQNSMDELGKSNGSQKKRASAKKRQPKKSVSGEENKAPASPKKKAAPAALKNSKKREARDPESDDLHPLPVDLAAPALAAASLPEPPDDMPLPFNGPEDDAHGEITLEEYRKTLESYMASNNITSSNNPIISYSDEDVSVESLEDWPEDDNKPRGPLKRAGPRAAPNKRKVDRAKSGQSMMSCQTFKSNGTSLSGLSMLTDMSMDKEFKNDDSGRRSNANSRRFSSNASIMSELTDISHTLDELDLDDDI